MSHESKGTKLLRSVTQNKPHTWCPSNGWHNENECPDDK